MENVTDEQLVGMYLKGDSKSLEILIQRYLNPIYNFVYKYIKNSAEAEDVTQEVFVKVWKNIKKFNPDYKFKTWVFSIAKNASLDFLKKKKAVPFSVLDGDEENYKLSSTLTDKSPSILEILKGEDNFKALNFAIGELPFSYRSTLNLRYEDGLKFREIAALLKESLDTVKTRHRRALQLLKKHLS